MKQPLLGKKIIELRKKKGLTQEDLVEKCNINVRTIQRIESGETTPRIYTIKIILNALGLDYEKIFEKAEDDYSSIMIKAITDRLAEAFAEYMHDRIRQDLWGYQTANEISTEDMIKEKYEGIRPAPGYPACPEHTVKKDIFELLKTDEIGMKLTESMAMLPASSVSGFYFSHPKSNYFSVGKIDKDQIIDMAKRRDISVDILKKWLASNLR